MQREPQGNEETAETQGTRNSGAEETRREPLGKVRPSVDIISNFIFQIYPVRGGMSNIGIPELTDEST